MQRGKSGHAAKAVKVRPPKQYAHQIGQAPQPSSPKTAIAADHGAIEYVAEIGTCTITLNNESGRYSPDNAASPLYGQLLPRRPVTLTATDGVTVWPLFAGYIDQIAPEAGQYSSRHVVIACVDALALLAFQHVSLPLQQNVIADVLISQLVSATYTPTTTNYQTGNTAFDIAADLWSADRTTALDAIRECAASEFGRFFIQRDGTPTFYNRRSFFQPIAPALTIDATIPAALAVARDVAQVFNVINVVSHPRNTLSVLQVIAQASSSVLIPPISPLGAGIRYITLHFHDGSGNPVGGTGIIVPLVAGTDYVVNERKDNSGVFYTVSPYFTLSVTDIRGSEITIKMTNSALGVLYANGLQVRGRAITTYDPVTQTAQDSSSISAYQKRGWTHDLPLSADVDFAQSLAAYLLDRYSQPFTRVDAVTIHNEATVSGSSVFAVKLFDQISVSDPQTGVNALRLLVIGTRIEITPDDFTISYVTERGDDRLYWLLGTTALGTNSRLAV
jgi:hypothetical protein